MRKVFTSSLLERIREGSDGFIMVIILKRKQPPISSQAFQKREPLNEQINGVALVTGTSSESARDLRTELPAPPWPRPVVVLVAHDRSNATNLADRLRQAHETVRNLRDYPERDVVQICERRCRDDTSDRCWHSGANAGDQI